jgi:hypothetical protein
VSPAAAQKHLLELRRPDGSLCFDIADVPDTVRIASFFSAEKARRRAADTRAVTVPFVIPVSFRRIAVHTCLRSGTDLGSAPLSCRASQEAVDHALRARASTLTGEELAAALAQRGQLKAGNKQQKLQRLQDYWRARQAAGQLAAAPAQPQTQPPPQPQSQPPQSQSQPPQQQLQPQSQQQRQPAPVLGLPQGATTMLPLPQPQQPCPPQRPAFTSADVAHRALQQ